jgi:hypothetical protein
MFGWCININDIAKGQVMSEFTFQMLLQCQYTGSDNTVEQLHVEQLVDGDWQLLELNIYSPGFDVFMYAILTCQHMYFQKNATERKLVLDSSEGLITINADQHRSIESLHVDFTGRLKSGTASDDTILFLEQRMGICPVSINLKNIPDRMITVSFVPA